MSSKVKSGAEKRRLKEKELFEKAGTNPKQKKLWSFVKINDEVEVSVPNTYIFPVLSYTILHNIRQFIKLFYSARLLLILICKMLL